MADANDLSSADSVLADLSQAETHAQLLREEWEQQKQALHDAEDRTAALQAQLVGVQETNTRLAQHLQAAQHDAEQQKAALQAQADDQRAQASAQHERNKQLEAIL